MSIFEKSEKNEELLESDKDTQEKVEGKNNVEAGMEDKAIQEEIDKTLGEIKASTEDVEKTMDEARTIENELKTSNFVEYEKRKGFVSEMRAQIYKRYEEKIQKIQDKMEKIAWIGFGAVGVASANSIMGIGMASSPEIFSGSIMDKAAMATYTVSAGVLMANYIYGISKSMALGFKRKKEMGIYKDTEI